MLIIPWHVTFRFLQSILSCKQYNFRIFSLLYLVFPRYMKITLESFTYLLRWILHLKYKKVIMYDMFVIMSLEELNQVIHFFFSLRIFFFDSAADFLFFDSVADFLFFGFATAFFLFFGAGGVTVD